MSWECMRGRVEIPTTRLENDLGGELVRTSQGARKVQSTGHAMRQSVRLLNRPAYRCRRRCLLPTGRDHLHDALQSRRLPFWFGLAGSISDTVRCRRGQLYLGMPDTYPCRAARLSRWFWGYKIKPQPSVTRLWFVAASRGGQHLQVLPVAADLHPRPQETQTSAAAQLRDSFAALVIGLTACNLLRP